MNNWGQTTINSSSKKNGGLSPNVDVDLTSRAQAITLITDYIEQFYNRRRIHQSLGYRTPEQVEKQYRGA